MKNLFILLLLLPLFTEGQTIKKIKGQDIVIIDDDQTTPIDSCQCKPGEPGKTPTVTVGTTTVVPYTQPPKAIGVPTSTGVRIDFELPSAPPQPNCPSCPPSGGGTVLRSVFFLTDYANGDDGNIDTQKTQEFFNAVINARGYGMIPPPNNQYLIDNTINIQPASGTGQVWAQFHAWGRGGGGSNIFTYVGPSNKSVFLAKGLKNAIFTGFYVGIQSGRDHVTIMDLDGDSNGPSIGFVTFKNNYYNLGPGQYNVGTRIGHLIGTFPGTNGDISNIQWENCMTTGGGTSTAAVPGQIAYLHEGRNSLSFTWFGGFGSFLESVYSNKSGPGAQFDRGNGSVFFKGYGTSQNDVNFVVAFEQGYEFEGGRHESFRKFLRVVAGGNAAITVKGAHLDDCKSPDGSAFDIQVATTLSIEGCNIKRGGTARFDKMVNLMANGNFGTISVRNCAIDAPDSQSVVRRTAGTTKWRVYIQGVNRLQNETAPSTGGVFTDGFLQDINGQELL